MKKTFLMVCAISLLSAAAFGQNYRQPSKVINDILNAPAIPNVSVSPTRERILLLEPLRYPPIAELAEPMLRLAGTRVNPNTNGSHRQSYSGVNNVFVNTAFGGFSWEGSNMLSATHVPAKRGPAPAYQNLTPREPNIQETTGRRGVGTAVRGA